MVIPRKGKPSQARRATEHSRPFRRLVKWRTGSEGRISYLKRRYGLDRTLLDGLDGTKTWCGLGVLTHNTIKIAALAEAAQAARSTAPTAPDSPATGRSAQRAPRTAQATGPPGSATAPPTLS